MGSVEELEAVLPEIAAVIGTALRSPYVSVSVAGDTDAGGGATWGRERWGADSLELCAQGEVVGTLEMGRREPNRPLEGQDRRLMEDLARQAALAVVSVRRGQQLQASQQRLVGAREEERRRLRRDLHDGLGPALAAMTLQLDEVAEMVERDSGAARRRLTRIRSGTQELITDVRRLVYDLRPPTLDELGLVGAIRQHAGNLSGGAAVFDVTSTPTNPVLPAAVEVALWRIATEAMTNVVRHARAGRCWVALDVSTGSMALLEVADDGMGIHQAGRGVGLTAAHERAAELGGRFTVETRPSGGTLVRATLPLAAR